MSADFYSFLNEAQRRRCAAELDKLLKPHRHCTDPFTGMAGPYVLDSETVANVVGKHKYGWYWLGRSAAAHFPPRIYYVGRSDTDLAQRILDPRKYKYTYFWFHITSTVHDAFNGECLDWHKFTDAGAKLDNEIHPDEPDDHKYPCPVKGCDESRGRQVAKSVAD